MHFPFSNGPLRATRYGWLMHATCPPYVEYGLAETHALDNSGQVCFLGTRSMLGRSRCCPVRSDNNGLGSTAVRCAAQCECPPLRPIYYSSSSAFSRSACVVAEKAGDISREKTRNRSGKNRVLLMIVECSTASLSLSLALVSTATGAPRR